MNQTKVSSNKMRDLGCSTSLNYLAMQTYYFSQFIIWLGLISEETNAIVIGVCILLQPIPIDPIATCLGKREWRDVLRLTPPCKYLQCQVYF